MFSKLLNQYDRWNALTCVEKITSFLTFIGVIMAILALADLAVRAAVRLETHWDTFWYHLPFSALRGGLNISYDLNDMVQNRYFGFPPLPHILQGILWRLTASVNATGIVNYAAYFLFLLYCRIFLRARFWLIALISLTAPLVIIHAASSYVDLFGNSLLAIAVSSCLYIYLFPEHSSLRIFLGGLLGLIGAAWSKFQLVPVVALIFVFYALLSRRFSGNKTGLSRWQSVSIIVAAIIVAALPYLKNLWLYGNPFWPVRVPLLAEFFPYIEAADYNIAERPPPLKDYSQFSVYIHSLFEIDHPGHYDHRLRWIIDQGNAWVAFRAGGFWYLNVIFYVIAVISMLIANNKKSGIAAGIVFIATLCFIGFLPQAHELRYYLFIPLSWAAAIGILFPSVKEKLPCIMPFFLMTVIGLFSYMVFENRDHYRIEKIGYEKAANMWGADRWWPGFKRGQVYCVVEVYPLGIMLTGPTMTEFIIVDRSQDYLCPAGSTVVTKDGAQRPLDAKTLINESMNLYNKGQYRESLKAGLKAIEIQPDQSVAYNNLCAAYNALQQWEEAVAACEKAIALQPDFILAKNNLAWAKTMAGKRNAAVSVR